MGCNSHSVERNRLRWFRWSGSIISQPLIRTGLSELSQGDNTAFFQFGWLFRRRGLNRRLIDLSSGSPTPSTGALGVWVSGGAEGGKSVPSPLPPLCGLNATRYPVVRNAAPSKGAISEIWSAVQFFRK